jgi:hypothetical protein
MSSYTTNAGNLDAALLDDGVADTLAAATRRPAVSRAVVLWKCGNDHVAKIATSMVDNANCHVSLYLRH